MGQTSKQSLQPSGQLAWSMAILPSMNFRTLITPGAHLNSQTLHVGQYSFLIARLTCTRFFWLGDKAAMFSTGFPSKPTRVTVIKFKGQTFSHLSQSFGHCFVSTS